MSIQTVSAIFEEYNNFNDAILVDVAFDPLDQICLKIKPLIWHGSTGKYEGEIMIKFRGVKNQPEIIERFKAFPKKESEIGFLGIDVESLNWKSGALRFKLIAERRDYEFSFTSSDVRIKKNTPAD